MRIFLRDQIDRVGNLGCDYSIIRSWCRSLCKKIQKTGPFNRAVCVVPGSSPDNCGQNNKGRAICCAGVDIHLPVHAAFDRLYRRIFWKAGGVQGNSDLLRHPSGFSLIALAEHRYETGCILGAATILGKGL